MYSDLLELELECKHRITLLVSMINMNLEMPYYYPYCCYLPLFPSLLT